MGELMRQYWIPAAMSSELKADGAPMRLMLLGEQLIAFRDSSGRVGVMDHRCPHRCASLFLGRNEENGMRCVYHGWKFDADGNCVDMPNVAGDAGLQEPHQGQGLQGRRAQRPRLGLYGQARRRRRRCRRSRRRCCRRARCTISFVQRECNWLQALEGDIDTSHFGFLHAGGDRPGRSCRRTACSATR